MCFVRTRTQIIHQKSSQFEINASSNMTSFFLLIFLKLIFSVKLNVKKSSVKHDEFFFLLIFHKFIVFSVKLMEKKIVYKSEIIFIRQKTEIISCWKKGFWNYSKISSEALGCNVPKTIFFFGLIDSFFWKLLVFRFKKRWFFVLLQY